MAAAAVASGAAAAAASFDTLLARENGAGEKTASPAEEPEGEEEVVANWSNTHEVRTRVLHKPENLQELEAIVRGAHAAGRRIRPLGSAISPNGLGLSEEGMVTLVLMDRVLAVDEATGRVRVQAGARVEQVVEALRPRGLTLQNFASVREQQIGGFIQVGAHGTGARIPPVDEQVVSFALVTPGRGTLEVSAESDPELFLFARCGLGALGVVAEVTLQCVPAHRLLEETFLSDATSVRRNHRAWLEQYQHLRYMWIPDTDSVVVVRSSPLPPDAEGPRGGGRPEGSQLSETERVAHVKELYKRSCAAAARSGAPHASLPSDEEIEGFTFTELRDRLLALRPLDKDHVAEVNRAEARYWKMREGSRVGWSDEILGFDCGGQQWVSEVAFHASTPPAGAAARAARWLSSLVSPPAQRDLDYVADVLRLVEEEGIAAPAPIEQRWTTASRSPMSPVHHPDPASVHSWVGIIMYLPTEDEGVRAQIAEKFFEYKFKTARALWDKYDAREHWAKLEIPGDAATAEWLKGRLAEQFPVERFAQLREQMDPKNILGSTFLDEFLPRRGGPPGASGA